MNIYVGNLAYDCGTEELKTAFEAFGQVTAVNVIMDKATGRSRGFGFVEMPSSTEAQAAIQGLNGKDLKGRNLNINEARPRSEDRGDRQRRPGGAGGGGRRPY